MKNNSENKKLTFKEKWNSPNGKIIIKLKLWFLFFITIYFLAFILSATTKNNDNQNNVTTSTTKIMNYNKMKTNLVINNQEIKYYINDYYIEGKLEEGILTGTLEIDGIVYRIKYDGENLYQMKKELEEVNNDLMKDINISYLLPKNIINILNESDNEAVKDIVNFVYSYEYNEVKYEVKYDEAKIINIHISDQDTTYNLVYKEI